MVFLQLTVLAAAALSGIDQRAHSEGLKRAQAEGKKLGRPVAETTKTVRFAIQRATAPYAELHLALQC
jgi:hypothetical protein